VSLLETISRGEFIIQRFRNRDVRTLLLADAPAANAVERRRQSARVTRLLQPLRAHHLIDRVEHTHCYQVTATGRTAIAALLAARGANTKVLLQAA